MYLVVIEDKEDGTWWDDPSGWDDEDQAREYARNITRHRRAFPSEYEVAIYRCYRLDK